ncbi:hypothetical protein CBR_g16936 [Chara braunii]|uniref:Profilin n=1 Tax=Chara braunii TaxID=69332 RepID=A0A388KU49_CHABU|nr:hypothetical protein CBR_g16936 [Chara braunii]|eukprot:GBG73594.1 hypothetical protein CBR_g16936 [Chara braunii]
MSWDGYIDSYLMCALPSGQLKSAGIIGLDGVVWARSENFPDLSEAEVQSLIGGFKDEKTLSESGLKLGGVKYMLVQGDQGVVIRAKKGPGLSPKGGATIKKTATALIIGLYEDPVQHSDCNVVVEQLGDYLIQQSY